VTNLEEHHRHNPIPIETSTQIYIYQRNKAKRNAQLLIEDPTGNKLIETSVEEIRQDAAKPANQRTFHRFYNYQEPQIVLAGAEFAKRAYQELYPLTL
jgi:hypothetical protein